MSDNGPLTEATELVTEPAQEVVSTVETATVDTMAEVRDALHIQGQRIDMLSDSFNSAVGNMTDAANRMVEAVAGIGITSANVAADVATAVTEVPEGAAETVEATVENVTDPPKVSKRRLIGRRRN